MNQPFFAHVLHYLGNPQYQPEQRAVPFRIKLWHCLRLWSLAYAFSLPLGIAIFFATRAGGYDLTQNAVYSLLSDPSLSVLLLVGIIAPVSEEIGFRLWLRYSPINLSLSIGYILYLAGSLLIANQAAFPTPLLLGFLGTSVVFLLLKSSRADKQITYFYQSRFRILFYGSCILFGLVHIFNYPNYLHIWYLIPLLFLPQLIIGLFLGFVRVHYGIGWSILTHGLYNGFLFLPQLLLLLIPEDIVTSFESGNISSLMQLSPLQIVAILIIEFSVLAMLAGSAISFFRFVQQILRPKKNEGSY